ncbi:unnamed protein product [Clonostachys byssicola]|uniref:Uncharacterized protein n=1 Tax=Clonostachys byssicola TaxID=160290 RepID=A0A9N9TYF2_9HYPO|nr:unnamed protein product [Clonostachys byssicola]
MVLASLGGPRLEGQLGIDLLLDVPEARPGRETACDLEVHAHEVQSYREIAKVLVDANEPGPPSDALHPGAACLEGVLREEYHQSDQIDLNGRDLPLGASGSAIATVICALESASQNDLETGIGSAIVHMIGAEISTAVAIDSMKGGGRAPRTFEIAVGLVRQAEAHHLLAIGP